MNSNEYKEIKKEIISNVSKNYNLSKNEIYKMQNTFTAIDTEKALHDKKYIKFNENYIRTKEYNECSDKVNDIIENLEHVILDDGGFASLKGYDAVEVPFTGYMVTLNRSNCIFKKE